MVQSRVAPPRGAWQHQRQEIESKNGNKSNRMAITWPLNRSLIGEGQRGIKWIRSIMWRQPLYRLTSTSPMSYHQLVIGPIISLSYVLLTVCPMSCHQLVLYPTISLSYVLPTPCPRSYYQLVLCPAISLSYISLSCQSCVQMSYVTFSGCEHRHSIVISWECTLEPTRLYKPSTGSKTQQEINRPIKCRK